MLKMKGVTTMATEAGMRNLYLAACITREADADQFSMALYHSCGTPCCVIGNYAASSLQKTFQLQGSCEVGLASEPNVRGYGKAAEEHFSITAEESYELFSQSGCGHARTPTAAADYIESFIRRKGFGYIIDEQHETVKSALADDIVQHATKLSELEPVEA